MTSKTYRPYYLEAITAINDSSFVLDIRPYNDTDTDYYHQIHIIAPQETFDTISDNIGGYIYIELLSTTELEVHQGEFYEEITTAGSLPYSSFEIKQLEKTGRTEWKSQYNQLLAEFKKLFAQKVKLYEATRNKVTTNYKAISSQAVAANHYAELIKSDLDKGRLFDTLYQLLDKNPAWDGLSDLIEPGYLMVQTLKDWGLAYAALKKTFEHLQNVDVRDYATIKKQTIERYTNSFKHMLNNRLNSRMDIDEKQYNLFFQFLMDRLQETEG